MTNELLHEGFKGLGASIVTSQSQDILMDKQAGVSDLSEPTRAVIAQLTPEASNALLNAYKTPTAAMTAPIFDSIASRELSIENASKGAELDSDWLSNANDSQPTFTVDDDWNTPTP